MLPNLKKIISGGQTGVDRAALDVALELKIPCGGWCPKGRRSESGEIAAHYPLQETPSHHYSQRTRWNVRDSNATLILSKAAPTGGTLLTKKLALELHRPVQVVDPTDPDQVAGARNWIREHAPLILNIAGPRESTSPGIYQSSIRFLSELLKS